MSTLHGNDVHIWHAKLSDMQIDDASLSMLSLEEQSNLSKKKNVAIQQNYIKSRVFLRKILSLYLKKTPSQIQFYFNEHKKPFVIENGSGIDFNLSHTKDRIVCAIAHEFAVGVDVESIERTVSFAVAEHYFHVDEQAYLNQLPIKEKHTCFFNIWTRKEAVLKALGVGLSFPMQSFSVLPLSRIQLALNGKQIDLQTAQLDEQNVVGLAALEQVNEIVLWNYSGVVDGS